jgi:hypothetical protein
MPHDIAPAVLRIAVVDPRFDDHVELAAEARAGQVELHFRASGAEALKLARHRHFDAWLVAGELEDMAGRDFAGLLRERIGAGLVATQDVAATRVLSIGDSAPGMAGVSLPVTVESIRAAIEGPKPVSATGWWTGKVPALPLGVTAAVMAIALLVVG